MAERAAAVLVRAALCGRDDVALVLDRAGAQQQQPVRQAGGVGERGRHEQHVARRAHQAAVQLGKAQVVADRQAGAPAALLEGDRRVARLEHARLVVGFLAVVEGEQVDLVVAGQARAVGAVDAAGVAHAARRLRRDRQRAADQRDAVLARGVGQEALDRAVAVGLGDVELGVVAQAHQAEVFGQRHPLRAGLRGLRDEAAGGGQVAVDVGVETVWMAANFVMGFLRVMRMSGSAGRMPWPRRILRCAQHARCACSSVCMRTRNAPRAGPDFQGIGRAKAADAAAAASLARAAEAAAAAAATAALCSTSSTFGSAQRARDVQLARAGLGQRAAQEQLREEGADADHRVDGGVGERGGAGVDLGHDDDVAGPASRPSGRRGLTSAPRPLALRMRRSLVVGDAVLDQHVAGHVVEREAFGEQVAEVEHEAARQRLQAQHAQQARRRRHRP